MRVYPPDQPRGPSALAPLLSVTANVPVVGILSASQSSPARAVAFANRVIGRRAFDEEDFVFSGRPKAKAGSFASIHLYYDDARPCVFLLGVARPESECFASRPVSPRKPKQQLDELDEPVRANDAERVLVELAAFEREKLKMQVLLFASCQLVYVLQERARVTTGVLDVVRQMAAEKAQLVHHIANVAPAKGQGKRDAGNARNPPPVHVFSPGHCVPVALFVVPATDEILRATVKASSSTNSSATRSAAVVFSKAIETRLLALFRTLRGGPVGTARMRDALSGANLGKERRLFTMDPSHSVVLVSRQTATAAGGVEARMMAMLDNFDLDQPWPEPDGENDGAALSALLQPLEEDDTGFSRALQYQQRLLDHLAALAASPNKEPHVRTDLPPLAQWLRAFQTLVKAYHRMDTRRRQDLAASRATMGGSSVSSVDGD